MSESVTTIKGMNNKLGSVTHKWTTFDGPDIIPRFEFDEDGIYKSRLKSLNC